MTTRGRIAWGTAVWALSWGLAAAIGVANDARAEEPAPPAPKSVASSPKAFALIRRIAIQHSGRRKPFDSFARETLKFITGSARVHGQDPVLTILSIAAYPDEWQAERLIAVPLRPLRERLGMAPRQARISYTELVATRTLMRMLPDIVEKQQRDEKLTMLEQETMDVFERFRTLSALFEQTFELVPAPSDARASWLPIFEAAGYPPERQAALRRAWTTFVDAARSGREPAATETARALATQLRAANPAAYPEAWRLNLEVAYNYATPFRIARVLYLVACLLLIVALRRGRARSLASTTGMRLLIAACVVHASDMTLRVIIGGRPPVSNFYETMLWLPFVAVVVALVFERIYRARYFGLAASIVAAVMLFLADAVPLDSSISPVVAVLRSNLWLTVHVLTIVASYGALALATVMAHLYAIQYLARRGSAATLAPLGIFLYRTIQVAIVLLAAGIMLGAVWANASWGRYWGWDPKETWALITLLWFLALVHGRFMGWLHGIGLAISTIAGFFLMVMTYYGVSFYLVGLHSYAGGHAKPVPPLLIGFLAAEATFITVVGVVASTRKTKPRSA